MHAYEQMAIKETVSKDLQVKNFIALITVSGKQTAANFLRTHNTYMQV